MRKPERRLLRQVVEVARGTLREMEWREVPRSMHRVAQSTGQRLPAPLEKLVLKEIDQDEWLREQVAEDFDGSEKGDDPHEQAAALFLLRPDGWEDRLERIRRDLRDAWNSARIERHERRIGELESELKKWKGDARQARVEAEEARRKADRRVEQAWEEARSTVEPELIETCDQLRRDNRRLAGDLEAARAELENTGQRLAETRGDLERERRIEHAPPAPPAGLNVWADMDAVEAARQLDGVVQAFFPGPAPVVMEPAPAGSKPLVLPAGVAPYSPQAVEWLIELDRPFALLVDGYNVTAKMYPPDRFSRPEIRDRLQNDLAELKVRARGRPRITVVWDSGRASETSAETLPNGIEVRYTREGWKADDELIDLAGGLGASAAVVSSDREVREQAQRAGSLGLWSEALATWALNG
ncbi:MAG: NYN domain-containing protein [bacterium]|nr:NYN domain-containing protein [bacterium]